MSNYVIIGGELMHYGVKGMKWGVRRFENKNGTLTPAGKRRYSDDVYEKKAAYKQAKKDYNKSFNKAYNKSVAAYSPIKKHRKANDERWDDAFKKAESANKAKADYKKAKKDYDNSPEGKAAAAERRKKAIKVGAAVAGTAIAAYGAYKVHEYVRERNKHIRVGQELVKANEQIFANLNNSRYAPGAINAQIQVYNNYKNKMADDILKRAQDYGRYKARNDSFAKAAKNVLEEELRRRRG